MPVRSRSAPAESRRGIVHQSRVHRGALCQCVVTDMARGGSVSRCSRRVNLLQLYNDRAVRQRGATRLSEGAVTHRVDERLQVHADLERRAPGSPCGRIARKVEPLNECWGVCLLGHVQSLKNQSAWAIARALPRNIHHWWMTTLGICVTWCRSSTR